MIGGGIYDHYGALAKALLQLQPGYLMRYEYLMR
jgi:hypothetical protein